MSEDVPDVYLASALAVLRVTDCKPVVIWEGSTRTLDRMNNERNNKYRAAIKRYVKVKLDEAMFQRRGW